MPEFNQIQPNPARLTFAPVRTEAGNLLPGSEFCETPFYINENLFDGPKGKSDSPTINLSNLATASWNRQ